MNKIMRSRGLISLLAILIAVSLFPVLPVKAQEAVSPLDFIANEESREGEGWIWDNESSTLTIDRFELDLTGYTEDYTAAVLLPEREDGVTVEIAGDGNATNYRKLEKTVAVIIKVK